jgi:hypothetical protein
MEAKNESEKIFEQYLDSNGFQGQWTYEPSLPGKSRKPDYMLSWKGNKCFFEVKELRKKPNEPTGKAMYFDPYPSLRSEIDEARKKFKEYKDYSCSLVVFNVDDRQARLDPLTVFGAMLGNLGITMDFNPVKGKVVAGTERNVFLDGGKMINDKSVQPQNTTISSIVVLQEFLDNIEVGKAMQEEMKRQGREFTGPELVEVRMKIYESHHVRTVPRLVIMVNPFARMAFPNDLFNGSFDEQWIWRKDDSKITKVFVGDSLVEYEALRGES